MNDKKCSRCGLVKPLDKFPRDKRISDGRARWCRICWSSHYQINRDRILQRQRDDPRRREYNRRYHRLNRDTVRKSQRQYAATHPRKTLSNEERKAKAVKDSVRYFANREAYAARNLQWQRDNPDRVKANRHKRSANKTGAGGRFTAQQWRILCTACGHRCLCCRRKRPLTSDHVVPVSAGGTSWIDNIQPLCGSCNSSKKHRTVDYRSAAVRDLCGRMSRLLQIPDAE
jgi:hypothetical protein